jgi:hypothetical protein
MREFVKIVVVECSDLAGRKEGHAKGMAAI